MKTTSRDFSMYPVFWLAIAFAIGIIAANWSNAVWQIWLGSLLFVAACTVLLRRSSSSTAALLASFVLLGAFTLQFQRQNVAENRIGSMFDSATLESGRLLELEGVVKRSPEPAFQGTFIRIQAQKISQDGEIRAVSGDVRLFVGFRTDETAADFEALGLRNGSRISVPVNLIREESFMNPGVVSRKWILDQQGIDAIGNVKTPALIRVTGDERVFPPLAWLFELRHQLINAFRLHFSPSTAGTLIASLLGDRYFLDKSTADVFREGGTFHVLIISGLHITFIGGLVLLFLRFFTKKRLIHFLVAAVFLWAYTLAVGAEVPVVRATLMFSVLAFSQVVKRRGTLVNSLGLSSLILLIWRPEDLFSASFQLTVVSVASIVIMAFPMIEALRNIGSWTPTNSTPFPPNVSRRLKRFCEMVYWKADVWEIESRRNIWTAKIRKSPYMPSIGIRRLQSPAAFILEAMIVSIAVQAWLLPLLVIYFHRITFLSAALNLWVGVFIALESFFAILSVGLIQVSLLLGLPFVAITELLNRILLALPGSLISIGLAGTRIPAYSAGASIIYAIYYLPILVMAWLAFNWSPFAVRQVRSARSILSNRLFASSAAVLLLLIGLIVFHPYSAPRPDGKLHVDFLDVGQGDSALFTFPNGKTMLVDGGGKLSFASADDSEDAFVPDTPGIGENVVSQFLWYKGYSSIDYVLATHADADHIQGLNDVVRNFNVKFAFFGRTPQNDNEFAELADLLRSYRIPVKILGRGDAFEVGGVTISVLNPEKDESAMAASDNDHSVVLKVEFGERKILMTGDIEGQSEKFLTETSELRSDVIKVPHHGSKTSSGERFVNAVAPEIAIISVGRRSMFGHPSPDVVDRWQKQGARVFKTGASGTISVITDGKELTVNQFSIDRQLLSK